MVGTITNVEIIKEMSKNPLAWINTGGIIVLSALVASGFYTSIFSLIFGIVAIFLFCLSLFGSYNSAVNKIQLRQLNERTLHLQRVIFDQTFDHFANEVVAGTDVSNMVTEMEQKYKE